MEKRTIIKEATGSFPFHFWIAKAVPVMEDGKMYVEGIASTPNVDHDHERFAPEALKAMARVINTSGVPLRVEHSQKDNAVIGDVYKAWVDERNQLWIKAVLNAEHPASGILYKGLKDGVRMGLSVGGYVKRATQELVEGLGKAVNTFYDVLLDEVSVTQRPSNYDARLMAKSFSKSQKEEEAMTQVLESNDFLFHSAMVGCDYISAIVKSVPEDQWVTINKNYNNNNSNMETKETTEEKKTKAAETSENEEKTTKASDATDSEKTEKAVTRAEFTQMVKMVSDGFNAMTSAIAKMSGTEAVDQRDPDQDKTDPEAGKVVDKAADETAEDKTSKATGENAVDQRAPDQVKTDPEAGKTVDKAAATESDGTDLTGSREKASSGKTDTYDLETVERAIKRIKAINKAMETEEDKTTKASTEEETETRKSIKGASIDVFAGEVATAIERMEKSMKDNGFQTGHIAKAVINEIRSNPDYQKDIAGFMKEAGQKKSVINGTPFVKMKDGRTFKLTLDDLGERTEKSADIPQGRGAFKSMWGKAYSSQTQNS